jgi:hypothetical protein
MVTLRPYVWAPQKARSLSLTKQSVGQIQDRVMDTSMREDATAMAEAHLKCNMECVKGGAFAAYSYIVGRISEHV